MSDQSPIEDLGVQLATLVANLDFPPQIRATGERLLERLSTPLRIGIVEAGQTKVSGLFDALSIKNMEDGLGLQLVRFGHSDVADSFSELDIVLWCTDAFGEVENAVWDRAPDHLKDHSLLVVPADNSLSNQTKHLEQVALQSFWKQIPIDGVDNDRDIAPLWRTIVGQVKQGKDADQDSAVLFVTQHKSAVKSPLSVKIAAKPVAVGTPIQRASFYEDAANFVHAKAQDLLKIPETQTYDVLAFCVDTAQTLSDMTMDAAVKDADFNWLKDSILLAADDIVLMSLEEEAASAIDAVTTLIQLQKDLIARCAA